MKNIRLGICSVLLIAAFMTVAFAQEMSVVTPLVFSQVGAGSLLLRDKSDRVYTAVIKSYEGFENFIKIYPIKFSLSKEDFKDVFYIVGFSDNHWDIAADGFKKERISSYYFLDIAGTGSDMDIDSPPKDKKYTAYVIIRVSDKVVNRNKISHVQIREGVINGLTQWY